MKPINRCPSHTDAIFFCSQTATTFDAAATFYHLVNIWGPPDPETQQKIKYAKWNAARIAKAIREGVDPNESNPKTEELEEEALDPNDPEVQAIGHPTITTPQPVTIEDVPDEDTPRDAAGISLPHSPASGGPSAPVDDGDLKLPGVPSHLHDPSPPPAESSYFDPPSMPSISPPSHNPVNYHPGPGAPPAPQSWTPTPPPQDSWQHPPDPPVSLPTFSPSIPSVSAEMPKTVSPPANYMDMTPRVPAPRTVVPVPTAAVPTYAAAQPVVNAVVDEAAIAAAQKHAKWAISALNFEDVTTAVRELRKALAQLGAS